MQARASKRDFTEFDTSVKWTRSVKKSLLAGKRISFHPEHIIRALYRPFVIRQLYFDTHLNEMQNLMRDYFGDKGIAEKPAILFTDPTGQKPFMVIASSLLPDAHTVGAAAGAIVLPSRVGPTAGSAENITDWALAQFQSQYDAAGAGSNGPLTKDAIFHYVYAVLHDPAYRETYAQNLKREFPRIPFYDDFSRWADWGEALMKLHIGYESVEPWLLERFDAPDEKAKAAGLPPKTVLKADKDAGVIVIDSETQLTGVPSEAWTYRLGNRSALEWILDQYKEKTPKDPTIREKFNTYRFANHKENVIDLLKRVTRVSIDTMKIVEDMKVTRR
ncbi:MAG TPA: type ISP restriction/modification enzyme [Beijerinckiaceae bacterium]|nr:type ISP restriction/modification enzyme [Beijerinckiaceae bacterium]